jgi:hypothetical protein
MNQEPMNAYDRIESYLDGLLDETQTHRFEQDLLKEDVAALFREVLLMRELLGELPPDEPPEGLVDRIEAALAVAPARQKAVEIQSREETTGFWTALKAGLSWPGYSVSAVAAGSEGLQSALSGMRTIGYALGPLRTPVHKGVAAIRQAGAPLWKSALTSVAKGVLR